MTSEGVALPWLAAIQGDYAVVVFGYVIVYQAGRRAVFFDLKGVQLA